MTSANRPAVLRALLQEGPQVLPGVFNAIAARLAERASFRALYISGAGVTNATLGKPDIALITLEEMARQCRYIASSVQAPCIADADTGFGGVWNVARTVEEYEAAGLAGLHIEDQVLPKRCGHLDGKEVVEASEMVRKVRAAVAARSSPEFLLVARTDARAVLGFEEAVDRGLRYLDAGADAVFPEALESREEFAEYARRVDGILLANMTEFGKSPLLPASELFGMGYRMVIYPMTAFRVMMRSGEEALRELATRGRQDTLLERMQSRAELYDLLDYPGFTAFDKSLTEDRDG